MTTLSGHPAAPVQAETVSPRWRPPASWRQRELSRRTKWILRIAFFVFIIVAWQIYAGTVSRALLAQPSDILVSFFRLYFVKPVMVEALLTTFLALLLGLGLAILLGVLIGIGMGMSRRFEWIVGPYVTFLFSIPTIALIPLLVIWLGIDYQLRVFLVVISAIFPVIINTAIGIRSTDRELVETAISFNANTWRTLWTVRIPASLPFIFAGISVALSLSLAGVVVAEMTATITGIGGLIVTYANFFQTANLFVPILTLMAGSVLLTVALGAIEKRVMPWQTTARRRS